MRAFEVSWYCITVKDDFCGVLFFCAGFFFFLFATRDTKERVVENDKQTSEKVTQSPVQRSQSGSEKLWLAQVGAVEARQTAWSKLSAQLSIAE